MITVQRVFWLHLLIAAAAPAIVLILSGSPVLALAPLALAALWLIAQRYHQRWTSGIFLFLFITGCSLLFWLYTAGWLLLLGGAAALGAWDLDGFYARLRSAGWQNTVLLIPAHLRRLLIVEGAGIVLGLVAMLLRVRLSFWWLALLALMAVIFITRLLALARKQAE